MSELWITNIGQLATPVVEGEGPLRGSQQARVSRLRETYVRIADDRIVEVGDPGVGEPPLPRGAHRLDAQGGTVIPGMVDPHTHACFAGWRVNEFTERLAGVPYKEILKAGGGILATMRSTRAASEDELFHTTMGRLDELLQHGTTTVEVKSGYGLDLDNELKQLRVINRAGQRHVMDVVPTFLGAHTVPPEFSGHSSRYIGEVMSRMLPRVTAENLARYVDVFCEPGVFDVEESRQLLDAATRHGLGTRVHADELDYSGGAELAVGMGAASADHLLATNEAGIIALARASDTVATLLPGTALMLGLETRKLGRQLVDAGAAVALATDFNPGSCPIPSMLLIMALGCLTMGLSVEESLVACTYNAACSLGMADRGVITAGHRADILLLGVNEFEQVIYRPGLRMPITVIKNGDVVFGGDASGASLAGTDA